MRWKQEYPKFGDLEIVTRFLFLPKTIADDTRWFEKATWERKYIGVPFDGPSFCWWKSVRWID